MIYVIAPTFQNYRFWVQRSIEDGTISQPKEAMCISNPTLLRGRQLTDGDRFEWLPGWDQHPQAEQIEEEVRMLMVRYERDKSREGAVEWAAQQQVS
jgi:hypothetical protein